jgi:hypothetical protein
MISIIKAQNLRFEAKGFKHGFQLLCQPFPSNVISLKKAYYNMTTLPIWVKKLMTRPKISCFLHIHPQIKCDNNSWCGIKLR